MHPGLALGGDGHPRQGIHLTTAQGELGIVEGGIGAVVETESEPLADGLQVVVQQPLIMILARVETVRRPVGGGHADHQGLLLAQPCLLAGIEAQGIGCRHLGLCAPKGQ
ncbi:hypothetical protein D3C78_1584850 [compost metagenome]